MCFARVLYAILHAKGLIIGVDGAERLTAGESPGNWARR